MHVSHFCKSAPHSGQSLSSVPWCRLWYVEPVVQLRRYAPYLVAEVTVESDTLREALTSGFKQVMPAKSIIQCTWHARKLKSSQEVCHDAGGWFHIW